jgi:hypothetical protein
MRKNNECTVDLEYEEKSYEIKEYRRHYMILGKLHRPFKFEQDMLSFNNRMFLLTQPTPQVEETHVEYTIQPTPQVEETIRPTPHVEETCVEETIRPTPQFEETCVEETIRPTPQVEETCVEETIRPIPQVEETRQSKFSSLNRFFNVFNYLLKK